MVKTLNDSVRFILELITIGLMITAALNINTLMLKLIFSIGFPICTVLFWGKYMAPLSPDRLTEIERIIVEITLFGGVGFISYIVGNKKIAILYLLVTTVNTILDHIL
ncbi:hypothetical protein A5821_001444 [Enterococcus sp. 7F3_DIV0205]|uniref:DUF2568 domain-containing protein n=1 Tax=Candidatus Enterococcus palustris TaxID=1834189 RepID=A0AAQ3W8U0_9ENTE|nr:YrdB family protein [Enterococcus sp. 7F3_DIV0205]OTN85841.1 hypothetical protein A5821_001788 [Enterococcus sp. 7F3_DIV0205]